jgi:hypothetical protein
MAIKEPNDPFYRAPRIETSETFDDGLFATFDEQITESPVPDEVSELMLSEREEEALSILRDYQGDLARLDQGAPFLTGGDAGSVINSETGLFNRASDSATHHLRAKKLRGDFDGMNDEAVRQERSSLFKQEIDNKAAVIRKKALAANDLLNSTGEFASLGDKPELKIEEAVAALSNKKSPLYRLIDTFMRGVEKGVKDGRVPADQQEVIHEAYFEALASRNPLVMSEFIDTARANARKQETFWSRQLLKLQKAARLGTTPYEFALTEREMSLITNAKASQPSTLRPSITGKANENEVPGFSLSTAQAEALAMPVNERGEPLHPQLGDAPADEREAFDRFTPSYVAQSKSGAVRRIMDELGGYVDAAQARADSAPDDETLRKIADAWQAKYQKIARMPYISNQLQGT